MAQWPVLGQLALPFWETRGPRVACGEQCERIVDWGSRLHPGPSVWRVLAASLNAGQLVFSGGGVCVCVRACVYVCVRWLGERRAPVGKRGLSPGA